MLNWHVAGEMTPESGTVLLILNLVSVAVLLGILYSRDIETGIGILRKRLYLLIRFRHWQSAHHARNCASR